MRAGPRPTRSRVAPAARRVRLERGSEPQRPTRGNSCSPSLCRDGARRTAWRLVALARDSLVCRLALWRPWLQTLPATIPDYRTHLRDCHGTELSWGTLRPGCLASQAGELFAGGSACSNSSASPSSVRESTGLVAAGRRGGSFEATTAGSRSWLRQRSGCGEPCSLRRRRSLSSDRCRGPLLLAGDFALGLAGGFGDF